MGHLARTAVDDARHTRRQHIVDRFARGVLLDVDRVDRHAARGGLVAAHVQVVVVVAPLAAHQFEGGEAQVGRLAEARHEHTHKADGREVVDRADALLILAQGDGELIPRGALLGAVAHGADKHLLIGDITAAHLERVGVDGNAILEVALILVERVVLVDILHIGHRAGALIETVAGVLGAERVALGAVVVFVTLENRLALSVEVVAAIEVVVVATRVVQRREGVLLHGGDGGGRQLRAQFADVIAIGVVLLLHSRREAVETHVLINARAGGVVKGVSHRRLVAHAAPLGVAQRRRCVVRTGGQAVLITLQAVLEDILAHLAQVEVEVAAVTVWVGLVDERVEHPELDILDVALLEIGVVEFAHNAAPSLLGVEQVTVGVDVVGIEVVWSALLGIEREVEGLDGRRLAVVEFAAGEHLGIRHLAHVGVRELVKVVLDISGHVRRVALREQAVDVVPGEQ